ncbi:hypothetical protein V6N00_04780 [Tersicoccus sp. MR15.9]|uniref:hypothetical protein n=1 Tax=Tersicoccus mangrovi TaxID=3121635 RepID=UPI002FE5A614
MSKNSRGRRLGLRVGATASIAALLMGLGVGAAAADVSVGQYVSNSGLSCGANERITGGLVMYGVVPTKQHAFIYRNCGSTTVHRKADVRFDWDGHCLSIAAGRSKVLHVVQALPSRDVYRGAKSC